MHPRKAITLSLAVIALPLALAAGSTALTPACDQLEDTRGYDLAFVLGAGNLSSGLPTPASISRTEAGVALWQTGKVRRLHFAGGGFFPQVPTALGMQKRAAAHGVPLTAMGTETASQSTLQNVANSDAALSEADSTILVTSGFHVWRAGFTMIALGHWPDAACQSKPKPNRSTSEAIRITLWEIPKWWGNIARSALWTVSHAAGWDRLIPDWVWT